jgi:hypothetical protein
VTISYALTFEPARSSQNCAVTLKILVAKQEPNAFPLTASTLTDTVSLYQTLCLCPNVSCDASHRNVDTKLVIAQYVSHILFKFKTRRTYYTLPGSFDFFTRVVPQESLV